MPPTIHTRYGGTVLFRLSTLELCWILSSPDDGYGPLPRGPRFLGESPADAAIRHTIRITGIPSRLLSIDITHHAQIEDDQSWCRNTFEPITITTLHPDMDHGITTIEWFLAAINEGEPVGEPDDGFGLEFKRYDTIPPTGTYYDDIICAANGVVEDMFASK
ncbi:NUDIX hydrolase domain-like protein [Hypoxylon crocopeplum]|nr:NUDIX hydrolase domain-like protein [Hypoxylon crocopeplum]